MKINKSQKCALLFTSEPTSSYIPPTIAHINEEVYTKVSMPTLKLGNRKNSNMHAKYAHNVSDTGIKIKKNIHVFNTTMLKIINFCYVAYMSNTIFLGCINSKIIE